MFKHIINQDVGAAIKTAFSGTIKTEVDIFQTMPDSILLEVFKNIRFTSMGTVAQVCRRWSRVALDELLWRKMFLDHYNLPPCTNMPPGAISWRMEFRRLFDEAPVLTADEDTVFVQPFFEDGLVEEMSQASFSNDGNMFALITIHGDVSVWELANPFSPILIKKNPFKPEVVFATPSCEFNKSDTCLLVNANNHIMGGGRIAVLRIDTLEVQCTNQSYGLTNAFGTWYSDEYILLQTHNSGSSFLNLWLCKVSEQYGEQKMLTYHLDSLDYFKSKVTEVISGCVTAVIPKMDIRKDIVVERDMDMDVSEEGDIQHNMPISTIDSPSSNKVFIHYSGESIRFKWLNLWQIFNNRVKQQHDVKISMRGTIDAMALSPCQTFICIACFPYDKKSLEISSYDLTNFDFVGRIINFPTPSVSAASILFMSVSTHFVALAGDGLMSGVIIERHYGVAITSLPCVEGCNISLNTKSGESMVSCFIENDDQDVFKIRKSRRQMRERKVDPSIKSIQVQERDIFFTLNRWSKTASDICQHPSPLLDENEILSRLGWI